MITISAFKWVPEFAQGQVRDLRARWALEEAGLPYKTRLLSQGDQDKPDYRALQPFGQAQPATTRTYGGTGLGLPITKGLVEAHGGTLTISSRAGVGTTVRIVLPKELKRLTSASL